MSLASRSLQAVLLVAYHVETIGGSGPSQGAGVGVRVAMDAGGAVTPRALVRSLHVWLVGGLFWARWPG